VGDGERTLDTFSLSGLPRLASVGYQPKGPARPLDYPSGVRDSAKSGLGLLGNRHLNNLAESAVMNVRGFPETEAITRRGNLGSVGAAIVVGSRESRLQGEGRQSVGPSKAKVTECQRGMKFS